MLRLPGITLAGLALWTIDAKENEKCAFWASIGECETNPNYMSAECPIACSWEVSQREDVLTRDGIHISTWKGFGNCDTYCSVALPGGRCVAACKQDGLCRCAEATPWKSSRCENTGVSKTWDLQLCACTTARTDEEIEETRDEAFGAPTLTNATKSVADPHIRAAVDSANDPLCSPKGVEIDALIHNGIELLSEAVLRLQHCGLVVLRNGLGSGFIKEYRGPFTDYVQGLSNGTISNHGRTSHNEAYFLHKLDDGRWEMLLPKSFASFDLLNSKTISSIMSHHAILGREYVLHSLGAALSQPGSKQLHWHRDSAHPLAGTKLVGSDVLPHAITMLAPLLNMTAAHGATEFCVGSHKLVNLDLSYTQIKSDDPSFRKQAQSIMRQKAVCAKELRRMKPLLKMGDVLLFDYNTLHRASPNKSPQLRSLLYLTFGRNWFKDVGNFDIDAFNHFAEAPEGRTLSEWATAETGSAVGTDPDMLHMYEKQEFNRLTETARFALPWELEKEDLPLPGPSKKLEEVTELFKPLQAKLDAVGYSFADSPDDDEEDEEDVDPEPNDIATDLQGTCAPETAAEAKCFMEPELPKGQLVRDCSRGGWAPMAIFSVPFEA